MFPREQNNVSHDCTWDAEDQAAFMDTHFWSKVRVIEPETSIRVCRQSGSHRQSGLWSSQWGDAEEQNPSQISFFQLPKDPKGATVGFMLCLSHHSLV